MIFCPLIVYLCVAGGGMMGGGNPGGQMMPGGGPNQPKMEPNT